MSGGYIRCGTFSGDDKSCSAISAVFEELPQQLPESERSAFIQDVLAPIEDQLAETTEFFQISPVMSQRMLPVVETLFAGYKQRYGGSEALDVIELDDSSGVSAST